MKANDLCRSASGSLYVSVAAGLIIGVTVQVGGAGTAFAQPVVNNEIEPNDNKLTATPADSGGTGLRATPFPAATDRIAGFSNGGAGEAGSADYFECRSGPENAGLYCYYLESTSATDHDFSMRGLVQSFGTILPFTDVLVQQATSASQKGLWYGFGGEEKVFIRVRGSGSALSSYVYEYRCEPYRPVPPDPDGGGEPWQRGVVRLTASSPSPLDLDLWVYDHNFNPIPGYGHDNPDASGLERMFNAGKYYVAVTDGNLLNNLPSPPDDEERNKPVLDYPNIVASSSPVFPIPMIMLTISQNGLTRTVGGPKVYPYQVLFFEFNVSDPQACPVCIADFNRDGGVDGTDVEVFFQRWEISDPCADIDGSGAVDGSDVQPFFDVWQTGGC